MHDVEEVKVLFHAFDVEPAEIPEGSWEGTAYTVEVAKGCTHITY